jgi:hypothetical protein
MMEAVSTSETSVNFYQTTRRDIQKDSARGHLRSRRPWPETSRTEKTTKIKHDPASLNVWTTFIWDNYYFQRWFHKFLLF